jgi:ABC-type glycerol-3-phosphate transport system substrate-binding protein
VPLAQEIMTAIQEIITSDRSIQEILDTYQPKLEEILE